MTEPLLALSSLTLGLRMGADLVRGLDLHVNRGEVLAVVGESGCGKSMTALAVMGLLPDGVTRKSGSVTLDGIALTSLSARRLRAIRGKRIAMIFQEPMTSLNPVLTVGEQIAEVVRQHEGVSHRAARARALEMMNRVKLPDAARRIDAFPHQLSGGQRQRVMIAAALACGPDLIIADEPTTALDVTIQAEVLRLLDELRRDHGTALMLITHDLGVVEAMADRVAVLYAGVKIEEGRVEQVLDGPRHPYTRMLMAARPDADAGRGKRLVEIAGSVPSPDAMPPGCAFAPRCPQVKPRCHDRPPAWRGTAEGHGCACVLHD
ncbi:MAG: ABC transporter ATP-binding protein [Pararhodobacter sp.]|nr:ABC transporter ATP-binding protein [Pararhodobacter sp.]